MLEANGKQPLVVAVKNSAILGLHKMDCYCVFVMATDSAVSVRPPCLKLPYLFGYKPISAISRDPKLLMQKINFIDTNCKCIILGYKPRAIFGLEVYRRP